ncbi:hypothetical protein JCM8547_001388 [Rhodosporidiobolus lusitaniae]
MKVVGLLSGGKDSVYNLLHCVLQGHQPVCVASLGPPEGKDELDSFMYQTVGHSGLKTIAEAIGLPFVSHTISGTAVNVGGEYGSRKGKNGQDGKEAEWEKTAGEGEEGRENGEVVEKDETEDLHELLKKVKSAHPEVEAVAAGAILSNYQRVRVEHVCSRLGLTPIAFLWERNQKELLVEMVEAGMESLLVKVAGAGLQVDHLGKSLAEMQPTLHRLNQRYQLHVCGEGGEYETFTVDCPLFKRRVILDKTTTIVSDPNPFSTIAHLHLDQVSLGRPKEDVPQEETWEELRERVRRTVKIGVPRVMEEGAEEWMRAGEEFEREAAVSEEKEEGEEAIKEDEEAPQPSARMTADGWVHFSEVVAEEEGIFTGEIEEEVRACFSRLSALLASSSASLLTLTHLTVLLSPPSSMSLFPRINTTYSSYFGTSPPTRACVAVSPSAAKWRVKLEGVARRRLEGSRGEWEERRALHVQSLSYWAAANIGPYSQAVKTASRVYIAGQIPLIPSTLTLPPSSSSLSSSSFSLSNQTFTSFSYHASLSLQHLRRIVDSSSPSWSSSSSSSPGRAEGAILWLSPSPPTSSSSSFFTRARTAHAVWEASERSYLAQQEEDGVEGVEEGKTAPFLAVEAGALPKGAEVEWQVTWGVPGGGAGGGGGFDSEDEEDEEQEGRGEGKETWTRSRTVSNDTGKPVTWQCSQGFPSSGKKGEARVSVFGVLGCSIRESRPHPLPGLSSSDLHSIRAFYDPARACVSSVRSLASILFSLSSLPVSQQPALSFVPSNRIATVLDDGRGEEHDVAFVVVGAPAS